MFHKNAPMFFLMFGVIFLLNFNFAILRSIRTTLAVVDLGSGAQTIPFFELFGALPAAFLVTRSLSKIMNRFSIPKVFLIVLGCFLGFFLIFSCALYPFFAVCHLVKRFSLAFSMIFYVISELWKPVLMNILFWGLVNQHVSMSVAKLLYAPLLFGSSLGSMAAGPLVAFCTSEANWTHALILMAVVLSAAGALTGFFYYRLGLYFMKEKAAAVSPQSCSLKESIKLCAAFGPLRLLSGIVLADYIAYSLGEVIFLDVLKQQFPDPCAYCSYMGKLSFWSSLLTLITALLIAPPILRRCRWVTSALILPLTLLVIDGLFFLFLKSNSSLFGWSPVVMIGSMHYSLCRALKYTLFDASKELVFVHLPVEQKMTGKLVIDGMCARLGRGGSSVLSLGLISLFGGVLASSLITGMVATGVVCFWIRATKKLGTLIEKDPLHV